MIRPGPRLVRALLGLAVASLLVPFLPELVWALALALAAALAVATAEVWALRRLAVTAERPPAVVLSHDEAETLPLALRTSARRPVRLRIRQLWPDLLDRPSSRADGVCRPGELLRLTMPVRAIARGTAPLLPPWVSATYSGWAERVLPAIDGNAAAVQGNAEVEADGDPTVATELTVLPNLAAVRRLRGQLDRLFLRGMGSRVSPHLGKGRDFDRLREYVDGDDLRDVAWKASARHGKLITREYRLDRSQDIVVCVDRGHRMAARVAHVTRLDHAVNAAVLLASIADRMEDRIGLLSFADAVEVGVAPGRGAAHRARFTAFSAGLKPEYRHTDYLALATHLRRRLRSRSLVLLVTTLPELEDEGAVARAVSLLVPQHLPLVIVFKDPALAAAADTLPDDKDELCRALVARDLTLGRQKTVAELRRRGALVIEAAPGEAGLSAVNGYLEVKRRQLL